MTTVFEIYGFHLLVWHLIVLWVVGSLLSYWPLFLIKIYQFRKGNWRIQHRESDEFGYLISSTWVQLPETECVSKAIHWAMKWSLFWPVGMIFLFSMAWSFILAITIFLPLLYVIYRVPRLWNSIHNRLMSYHTRL